MQKDDPANPDPRTGRAEQTDTFRPEGSGCKSYQTPNTVQTSGYTLSNNNFCLLTQAKMDWKAYEPAPDFKTWPNTTSNYWARPLWIRKNNESYWEEGVKYRQRLFYDLTPQTSQNRFGGQDGVQFGNVTTAEEGFVERPNTSVEGFVRLRATAYDYNPNVVPDDVNTQTDETVYIVGLPIRTRLYDETDICHAETRSIYTFGAQGNNYLSPPTASVVVKTEQALEGCFPSEASIDEYGEPNGEWAITQYFHDAYGNVTGERSLGEASSQDIEMSTEYDNFYKLFPLRRWNANEPDFEEIFKYYGVNGPAADSDGAVWGAMRRYCDVAGVCTRQDYDEFGRRTRLWTGGNAVEQGGNGDEGINTQYWYYYRYEDPQQPALQTNVVVEWNEPRCEGNFVRRHYNGLGQLIKQQMPDDDWHTDGVPEGGVCSQPEELNEIDVDYEYNALGNQARASVPYRRSGDWVGSGLNWNAGYTESTYDAINRPTLTEAPNGEKVRYRYGSEAILLNGIVYPLRVAVAEGLGQIAEGARILSWQGTDVLGRLTSTRTQDWDNNSYEWVDEAEVELTYDPADRLLETDLPVGAQATMSYDTGGRKTAMDDPDLGQWTYEYDRQGRLIEQTDALGCTTIMEYDPELGRLTEKRFQADSSSCLDVQWYKTRYKYDEGHSNTNRSRGKLTTVEKLDDVEQEHVDYHYYNPRGLLAQTTTYSYFAFSSFPGQGIPVTDPLLSTWYGYDSYLRPVKLTYPDGEVAETFYNSRGLAYEIDIDNGQGAYSILDNVAYNEAGQMFRAHMPNGQDDLWRRNTYYGWQENPGNGNHRLKESRVGTSDNFTDRLWLQYSYDSFADLDNLTEHYNGGPSAAWNFEYDLQLRLDSAFGRNFSWSPAGNLLNLGSKSLTYDASTPHSVNRIDGVDRFDRDANGNMTHHNKGQSDQHYFYWDQERQLSAVWDGDNPTTDNFIESYLYADDGRRVLKTTGAATTFYAFPHYEVTEAEAPSTSSAGAASAGAAEAEPEPLAESSEGASHRPGHPPELYENRIDRDVVDALLEEARPTDAELEATLDVDVGEPLGLVCPQELDELAICELPEIIEPVLPIDPILPTVEPKRVEPVDVLTTTVASTATVEFAAEEAVYLPLVNGEAGQISAASSSAYEVTYTKYYFLGGQRFALHEKTDLVTLQNGQKQTSTIDSVFRYIHPDHLGSTAIETDLSGQVSAERRYLAFGGERASSGTLRTENQFTSQKLDGTGLYYYGARYYDPAIGQFISPDTIVPAPGEVFAYNRYMYAYGNPLKFDDPDGHCPRYTGENHTEFAACINVVDRIVANWNETDYFAKAWGTKESFIKNVASQPTLGADFFELQWDLFLESPAGQAWQSEPVPLRYDGPVNIDAGDYTKFSASVGALFGLSFIVDDFGNVYASAALSGGVPGISVRRGDVLVAQSNMFDVKDIDALDLSREEKAQLMKELVPGLSGGIDGGGFFLNAALSTNIIPPHAIFAEGGLSGPVPASASVTAAEYTFYLFTIGGN